jgi:hypothetical protein
MIPRWCHPEPGSRARASGSGQRRLPRADAVAAALGAGRLAVGVAFLAAPHASVRILGVDTATAKRMTVLARMTAARDIGLGAGALSTSGRARSGWLLAGAGADAVDAAAIRTALRAGQARGAAATAIAAFAAGSGVVGAVIAVRRR